MDVRLTAEQQQLRDAAAKLADDLGPGSVQDLADDNRINRLDKQIETTGWRSLRSDEASGVEVAIVAEEFGRGLVDAPFLGPVLADDLARQVGADGTGSTIAVAGHAIDARGYQRALRLDGTTVSAADLGAVRAAVDLTRATADLAAAHEDAKQKNDHGHNRRRHEQKHQLLAVQLDLMEAVVLNLRGQIAASLARPGRRYKPPGRLLKNAAGT